MVNNNDLPTSSHSTARANKNTHVSRINFDHFNAETSKSVGSIDRSSQNELTNHSINIKSGLELKSIETTK